MDERTILTEFIEWLTSRPQRSGPFGANWGPDEAYNLLAEYLVYKQASEQQAAPVDSTSN